jgi:hypothetical protein
MSDPQIARRCASCGASIRERAFFCPECGSSLGAKTEELSPSPLSETAATQKLDQTIIERAAPSSPESSSHPPQFKTNQRPGGLSPSYGSVGKTKRLETPVAFSGDTSRKTEKLRKISSIVLDEAAYDPSLRFILVAVALFLLFLTILVLSKVIG